MRTQFLYAAYVSLVCAPFVTRWSLYRSQKPVSIGWHLIIHGTAQSNTYLAIATLKTMGHFPERRTCEVDVSKILSFTLIAYMLFDN